MASVGFTRRDLLAAGGLTALGGLPFLGSAKGRTRKRVLRIAHITDLHVQPELGAALGMEKCLEHAQAQKPDFIFMGGDQVMDSLVADRARLKTQWDVYQNVLRANRAVPVVHALGNHDVWGWASPDRFCHEAGFGKAYAMDRMELTQSYYSFDLKDWHFIVLDSVHPCRGLGYTAKLGRHQYEWLADDLARVSPNRHVMVMSHIPIVSASAFFHGNNERTGNWHVPGAWMHIDARFIKDLFARHTNVNACLAGHIHLVDRVDYQGVSYFCNGAGCGGWWGGAFQGVGNGYAVVDLFNDGSVENRYVEYGWKPRV
jgi:3',5'-cyclic AMP phosphodiesterase CpdA